MILADHKAQTFNFKALLFAFVTIFFLIPLIEDTWLPNILLRFGFFFIVIFSVFIVAKRRWLFFLALCLAIPAEIINWSAYFDYSVTFQQIQLFLRLGYHVVIIAILLSHIFRTLVVTHNVIYGAICVFLLIGLGWGYAYTLVAFSVPNSFIGLETTPSSLNYPDQIQLYLNTLIFYSFITLTTLGYGNIAPDSTLTSSLSAGEAIVGQLFIAILLARLIGTQVAHSIARMNIPKE